MPDDRPESPGSVARDKIHAALSHLATAKMVVRENDRQVAITTAANELQAALIALSTPAGPSPLLTHFAPATEAPPQRDDMPERTLTGEDYAAPSPREEAVRRPSDKSKARARPGALAEAYGDSFGREEAVDALDRDALIEMVTSAISHAAANRPKKEGTRQRFRRCATAAVDSLPAARPSSPEQCPTCGSRRTPTLTVCSDGFHMARPSSPTPEETRTEDRDGHLWLIGVGWELDVTETKARADAAHKLAEAGDALATWAEEAGGHYGVEECSRSTAPATEWDGIQDGLRDTAADWRSTRSPTPGDDATTKEGR